MTPDTVTPLTLLAVALLVFVICLGLVILRGIARMIVGTVILALASWGSFVAWQEAPALTLSWFGKPISALAYGLPTAAFIGSFILLRCLCNVAMSPFGQSADSSRPASRSPLAIAVRLLFALVPTGLILLICTSIFHHAGSVAEIRSYTEKLIDTPEAQPKSFTRQIKAVLSSTLPESWLRSLDPLAEPERLQLAKQITSQSHQQLQPVIDPSTGQPFPRAIVVVDPELQNLAQEGKFGTLLRHPLLTKALKDPQTRKILGLKE